MHLLALLLLQVALPPDIEADRSKTLARILEVRETVEDFDRHIADRFREDHALPKTGLLVSSADQPGGDGLHAITILGVLHPSPAQTAGVRPGDRLLRIGARRLEHEPTSVVYMLLEDKPGPVTLMLSRNGEELTLTVRRAPLLCLRIGAKRLDTRAWRSQLKKMRELLDVVADQLRKLEHLPPDERQPALDAAGAALVAVANLLPTLAENVRTGLYEAIRASCDIAFE